MPGVECRGRIFGIISAFVKELKGSDVFLGKSLKGFAAFCCFGLVLNGVIACSDDSASAEDDKKGNTTVIVTPDGDTTTVVIGPSGDTSVVGIDSIRVVTPEGDTIIKLDTAYYPADTTLRWVGNSALVITEIAPVNLDWLDEEGGDPGWVEIYNAGGTEANLKGYTLVENRKNARKWFFGNVVLKPKQFTTVFCDKKNLNEVAGTDTLGRHYRVHTNWKLEKDGGTVYLIDPYYGIRDSVTYPALTGNVSWGIVDGGAWKMFDVPTPEQPNNQSTAYDGYAPTFSFDGAQGGFYNDPVTLNPPSVSGGLSVRCTQDGSIPTKSSQEFNSPIVIDKNTVLRCAAFKDGLLTRQVVTNTYFIGEQVKMPVVSVSVAPEFFTKYYKKTNGGEPDMDNDQMYAPNKAYPDDSGEFPVHVEFYAEGSKSSKKAWEIDGGISLMGGWSRMERKKSVAIVMREEYEAGWLEYPLFETRKDKNSKFKGFNLRNNGNRFVADYFADAAGGAILEGSGVDYQRSRQVVVFYNGTYYGIHDMRERYNKNYVETNYGIDAGSVNFIKHLNKTVTASNGTEADYLAMLAFIGGNDMTVPENYEAAKTLIDIGNFADYMIAEMYIHNGDWPDNNVRAWKSPEQPWKFMVYDLDHGFEWDWSVSGFSQSTNMFSWVKKGGKNGCASAANNCFASLYNSLIKNADFKRLFVNHASVMFGTYLNGSNVTEKAKFLANMLDASDVERDMSVEAYKERRNSYAHSFDPYGEKLGPWASERDATVRSEYTSEFGLSGDISLTISANGSGTVLMEGMKLPGNGSYKGKFFGGMNMELTAVATGGAVFSGWSDGSTDNPHIITPTDGMTITANFK